MPRISDGKQNMSNKPTKEAKMPNENLIPIRDAIIAWLRQNNYSLASFDRLIGSVPGVATYTQLNELMAAFPQTFTAAKIKGGLPGLKLSGPLPAEEPEFTADDLSSVQVAPLETAVTGASEALSMSPVMPIDPLMPSLGAPSAPNNVPTPAPIPVREQLSPSAAIRKLIDMAAHEDNSSAAENYSIAAKEAAMAVAILKTQANIDL